MLKTVKRHSYLGIILHRNGSFRSAVSVLADKAIKAYFKIKMTVGLNISCKLLEKLFDTLVSPVLLYGSEIWGTTITCHDSDPFEHIHLKFIKEILGVHSKSFNAACRAELNRLPLKSTVYINIVNFLNHIICANNTLVQKVFYATMDSNTWTNFVFRYLDTLGFSFVRNSPSLLQTNVTIIKRRILDTIRQDQISIIRNSSKTHFISSMYNYFIDRVPYVDKLRKRNERAILCKIRISSHKLAIETGRYIGLADSCRNCITCKQTCIENELHFLLQCPAHAA